MSDGPRTTIYACCECILWHFVMLSQLTDAIKERDSSRQQTVLFSRPLMERLSIRDVDRVKRPPHTVCLVCISNWHTVWSVITNGCSFLEYLCLHVLASPHEVFANERVYNKHLLDLGRNDKKHVFFGINQNADRLFFCLSFYLMKKYSYICQCR